MMMHVHNKGADQPAYSHILISIFLFAIACYMLNSNNLAYISEQAGLSLAPRTGLPRLGQLDIRSALG